MIARAPVGKEAVGKQRVFLSTTQEGILLLIAQPSTSSDPTSSSNDKVEQTVQNNETIEPVQDPSIQSQDINGSKELKNEDPIDQGQQEKIATLEHELANLKKNVEVLDSLPGFQDQYSL